MKYINYRTGVAFLLLLTLFSCEQEEKFDYSGGNQIYFLGADSTTYSFAIQNSLVTEDTTFIPVAISGLAANKDREIKVEIVADGTTAVEGVDFISGAHFELGTTILKADSLRTEIPVRVFRQKDLKKKNVEVALRIVTGGVFLDGMGNKKLNCRLKINDILTKPDNWDSYIRRYFGDYGPVKYQFIIDKLGRYEFPSTGDNAVPKAEMAYMKDKLRTLLIEHEKENGPLYDEGDVKVTF